MSALRVHLPNQIVSGGEDQQEGPIGSESQGFPQCFLPSLLSPERSANKLKVNLRKQAGQADVEDITSFEGKQM